MHGEAVPSRLSETRRSCPAGYAGLAPAGSPGVAGDHGRGRPHDTSVSHAARRTGGAGPAGYDPDARLRPVHGGKPKAAAAAQDTPAADGTVISGTQAISATARPAGTVPHSFRFSGARLRKLSFAVARVRPLRTRWRRESSRRSQG